MAAEIAMTSKDHGLNVLFELAYTSELEEVPLCEKIQLEQELSIGAAKATHTRVVAVEAFGSRSRPARTFAPDFECACC